MKTAIVCGAGGFIGSHLVKRLKQEEYYVIGIDLKHPEFSDSPADLFYIHDLREPEFIETLGRRQVDEVYQLAADMGGAGYIFSGDHDADVMSNSAMININVLKFVVKKKIKKIFYSSSACIYPAYNQLDANNPNCAEHTAYPAAPDSEYGWEKLFSERLYHSYMRNYGVDVRVARFHNIFGPEGSYKNGKEKAPAAMCRKVAMANNGDIIEVWGDGNQTRSFLYIDCCIEGIRRLMNHPIALQPLNIGSTEMVSINDLVEMVMLIAEKNLKIDHVPGPLGVRGRCSDNHTIKLELGWEPVYPLYKGLRHTYEWINSQINGK